MKATATKNMPEFNFYIGQEVEVTPGQYKRFQEKYNCFEERDRIVSVRVITNMHRLYGWQGWYPNTLQGGSLKSLKPYINSGDLKIENERQVIDSPDNKALKEVIIDLVEFEAPKTRFHMLTPLDIYNQVKTKYLNVSLKDVFAICKTLYNEGWFVKHGPGYTYNWEAG